MNKYLLKNKEIRTGDIVVIDGADKVFDSNAYNSYIRNIEEFNDAPDIYVDDIDNDDDGEYVELKIPRDNDNNLYLALYRYNLSLKNAPRPLDINKISNYTTCILGKDITDAPYIYSWRSLTYAQDDRTYEKYVNTDIRYALLYDQSLKIINVKDIYVKVSDKTGKEYVFPHWFLYPDRLNVKNMYAPKKIKRFIDF